MRIAHANKLIYAIRIQTTNFLICLNRLRAHADKWEKLDVTNLSVPPTGFVENIGETVRTLIKTWNRLKALRNEWESMDAGTEIQDSMIGGDNEGLTKAEVAAVIGTTVDALTTLLNSGHGTNLYKLDVPDDEITKPNATAVIGTTWPALNSKMAEGHATNCYSIIL